jgi:hypothetical protein
MKNAMKEILKDSRARLASSSRLMINKCKKACTNAACKRAAQTAT